MKSLMRIVGVQQFDCAFVDFSGVQTPGVLDDLFFYEGLLGAHLGPQGVAISLWAPTAQQVCCLLSTMMQTSHFRCTNEYVC